MKRSIIFQFIFLPFFLIACEANVDLGDRQGAGGSSNGSGGTTGGDLPIIRAICGDGVLAGDEQCDDGNTDNDDECSAKCQIDPTRPTGTGGTNGADLPILRAICGDNVLAGDEQCDDGNTDSYDGCSADCTLIESGWTCSPGTRCVPLCGDGLVAGSERCDLGDLNGTHQGCTTDCRLDSNCGNLIVDAGEACDDGNTVSGDGCTSNCASVEPGWMCTVGRPCLSVCGDGVVAGNEQCDLGTANGKNEGCSTSCTLTGPCGNLSLDPGEVCDDGNTISGDGCGAQCNKIEPGWVCPSKAGRCAPICGDGVVAGGEECDLGTQNGTLNCNLDCTIRILP